MNIEHLIVDQMTIPKKLLTSYKELNLKEIDVIVILQIHRFFLEGKQFPTLEEISRPLTIPEQECALILRHLIQNQLLLIESQVNEHDQLGEVYSLKPLWEKLFIEKDRQTEENRHEGTIFILFEQEFGRPLSPFEIEMINSWLDEDKIAPSLIKAALRESVLMGKLNFKYIDRILQEWKRKGIRTVDQARDVAKSFREHQTRRQQETSEKRKDQSFYYNWLEDDD